MTIHSLGDAGLVLYLTHCDLRLRGLTPEALDLDQALELAREACLETGQFSRRAKEVDVYLDEGGALLFVHLLPPAPAAYRFATLHDFLDALDALPALPEGCTLYFCGRGCLLSLPRSAPEVNAVLSEFARRESPAAPPAPGPEDPAPLSSAALGALYARMRKKRLNT